MAFMFLKVLNVSRGKGHNAVDKAAYISRSGLVDEKTGELFSHSKRNDLVVAQIFTNPSVRAPGWALDRQSLWNQVERMERRINSRTAKELVVSLPHQLSDEQRYNAASTFAQQLTQRYGFVADLAIHRPPVGGDPRNHHAHILVTPRVLSEEGFAQRAKLYEPSKSLEPPTPMHYLKELQQMRLWWAQTANHEFKKAGLEDRLDCITPRYRAWLMQHRPTDIRLQSEHSEDQLTEAMKATEKAAQEYWAYRRQMTHNPPGPTLARAHTADHDFGLA